MTKHAPSYDFMIRARQPELIFILNYLLILGIIKIKMIQFDLYLFILNQL